MSVYLALHTSSAPNLTDVAEFGRIALALGGDPSGSLVALSRSDSGALSIVLPIPADVTTTTPVRPVRDAGDEEVTGCQCPPCPGRGNDGHGLTHCAECCFGSGVMADLDCPIHGDGQARPTTAAPVSGLAARAKGEGL